MHQSTRGSLPLSAVPSAYYYERETVPTSNSDLWDEFASGDVSRIVDFSYAGYDQGRSDPPFASAADGWNVIPVTCGADVCLLPPYEKPFVHKMRAYIFAADVKCVPCLPPSHS